MASKVANLKIDAPAKTAAQVFIVDDEALVGQVVETILSMEGFEARFFSDPVEALREFMAAERKPDLLLSDFVMTPMNGMELIGHCKQAAPGLHTVLYSGNVGEEILRRYTDKPDAFLTKPFLPQALIGTVRRVLEQET